MSSNEEERDRDGLALGFGSGKNTGLIRTGVLTAAILIAILYSRSCFATPPAVSPAPAEVAAVAPFDAPAISGIRISGDSAEISGRGEPGETVELFLNGNRVTRTTVGADGTWSYLATGLAVGAYEAVASHQGRAFDQSGRIDFTIDEASVSSTSAIQLVKPQFDSGLTGSTPTAGQDLVLTGTGTPNGTHILYVNGVETATTTAENNGAWQFVLPNMGEGEYDFRVVSVGNGNDEESSDNLNLSVSAQAINYTAGITDLTPNSDGTYSIAGTGTPGSTFALFNEAGDLIHSGIIGADGSWSFDGELPAETGSISVSLFGNGDGDSSGTPVFTSESLAITAPDAESGTASGDYAISITDVVAGDNSDAPVTISGEGTPGQTFAVYVDDVLVHSGVVGDDGSWSFSGIMPAGPHTISAQLFENSDGDVSGDSVATAESVEAEIAEARPASAVNSGRNGLFRILFGGQTAGAGEGDGDEGNSEGDSAGADGLAGAPAVELIVDASWSMTFPLDSNEEEDRLTADDPNSRIAIAQAAMVNLVENTLPEGVPVAVRAFGNIEGNLSCRTDLMSALQPLDRENVSSIVGSIEPQFNANTAIAAALAQVSNDLADTDREKIVVLLTDGQETCGGDPAAVIEQLAAEGTRVSLNIIGFAILDDELKAQFQEWAVLGNGEFFDASDADLLNTALEGAMTVGYTVRDLDGNFVTRGVVGGQFLDLEPGVYNISNSAGDVVYENVVITPGSVSALPGG